MKDLLFPNKEVTIPPIAPRIGPPRGNKVPINAPAAPPLAISGVFLVTKVCNCSAAFSGSVPVACIINAFIPLRGPSPVL